MSSGLSQLSFRCTGCGNCCRDLRVPLTVADVRRLVEATALSAAQIVDWLPSHAVDLTGEPGSLVVLGAATGRVLMTLAQQGGACRFLAGDQRCGVYPARPGNCRLYPFAASFGRRGGLRRLRLLSGTECDSRRDGYNDPHALRKADAQRWAEHKSYLEQVRIWNRAQRHRTLLGHRAHGPAEFLRFLGFPESSAR
jgi:Fe-S-cluster containining protein